MALLNTFNEDHPYYFDIPVRRAHIRRMSYNDIGTLPANLLDPLTALTYL